MAIRGKRFDGHDFVGEAFSRGASAALVEQRSLKVDAGCRVLKVADTLVALGQLARFHRERFRLDLVAVTGSSGKSTTKTMLAHMLSRSREVLATPGTQNNRIGVPLALFRLHEGHQAAVLELGTNQWGEIRTLTQISRPTMGVVTNIGPAHLETFGDLRGVLRAKGELWEAMEPDAALVLNADDPLLWEAGRRLSRRVVWFGCNPRSDFRATQIRMEPSGSTSRLNGRWELKLSLPGQHNLMNALAALACAQLLGEDLPAAAERLSTCPALPGRLNFVEREGLLVIDDTYNANPASLQAALKVLEGLRRPGRRVVALGDMLELGEQAEVLHAQGGRWVAEARADVLVTVGRWARWVLAAACEAGLSSEAGHTFGTPEEAGEFLSGILRPGDTLLLKGSRGMQMERVLASFTTSSTH